MSPEELELQRERLEIEKARLELEKVRQAKELRQQFLTRWAVVIPLAAALVGAAVTAWNVQAKAQSDFELTAAELAMDSESPVGVHNRARVLAALFPNRLHDFAEDFSPSRYIDEETNIRESRVENKQKLIELIAAHPEHRDVIVDVWGTLLPGDEWLDVLRD